MLPPHWHTAGDCVWAADIVEGAPRPAPVPLAELPPSSVRAVLAMEVWPWPDATPQALCSDGGVRLGHSLPESAVTSSDGHPLAIPWPCPCQPLVIPSPSPCQGPCHPRQHIGENNNKTPKTLKGAKSQPSLAAKIAWRFSVGMCGLAHRPPPTEQLAGVNIQAWARELNFSAPAVAPKRAAPGDVGQLCYDFGTLRMVASEGA